MSVNLNRVTLPTPLPQTVEAVELAKRLNAIPKKRRPRGEYRVTPRRAVVIQQVERWYVRKLELGTKESLARELNVDVNVVDYIIQRMRARRKRAQ